MDAYFATALLGLSLGGGAMWTGHALREYRLRRACRGGWLFTVGITGKPADLVAQQQLLDELHRSANLVGGRPNVVPFPGASARSRRGGESA